MSSTKTESLSRRERQIMDILHRRGEASAKEVQAEMPDPPSYSAVRAMLSILLEKEVIEHEKRARHYLYRPTEARPKAQKHALKRVLETFFDDSPEQLVASLLDKKDFELSGEEIERIRSLIDESSAKTDD